MQMNSMNKLLRPVAALALLMAVMVGAADAQQSPLPSTFTAAGGETSLVNPFRGTPASVTVNGTPVSFTVSGNNIVVAALAANAIVVINPPGGESAPMAAVEPEARGTVGSIAALNGAVSLAVEGYSSAAIAVSGTFVGTLTFQGTIDGNTWFTITGLGAPPGVGTSLVATTTAAGQFYFSTAGLQSVRATATAYTSGTMVVTIRGVPNAGVTYTVAAGTQAVSLASLPALAAGTAAIGDVGVQYRANATGAALNASVLSPATPAGGSIKASAGRLVGAVLTNTSAAMRSVKFYNATAVTMGTTAAAFEIDIPAGQSITFAREGGMAFTTGIMWAVTAAKGLTDNTATGLAANDVSGVINYQ